MTRGNKTFCITTLSLALVLAAVGLAGADSTDDDPFARPRTVIGFGSYIGGYSVGPVSGTGVGIHLDLGRQMGPLLLSGEYNLLSVGESAVEVEDPIRGLLHRIGLNARYSFAEFGGGRQVPVQGAFWVEAGLGRQAVVWHEGGKLTRDDLALGFGLQTNFRIGKHKPKPNVLGIYYAFRATIARSPDADDMTPATCGGPCDEPTAPSPYNLGLFFNMGVSWGR